MEENKQFDYMIVDTNYYIKRNTHALLNKSIITSESYKLVLKSFFTTLFRYYNELKPKRIICFLDKAPYRSVQNLPQYKSDRVYVQEEDIDKEEDPEKRAQLKRAFMMNSTAVHVRSALRKFFKDSYLNIFEYPGLEADSLCVLMKKMFRDNKEFEDKTAVLLSADSDWITFRGSQIQYYKTGRFKNTMFSEPDKKELEFMDSISPDLYKLGICNELYRGSHNNVPQYPYSVKFNTFCDQMCNPDKFVDKIPGFEEYKKYFDALDPLSYDNTEIFKLMKEHFLKDQKHDIAKIDNYFNYLKFNQNVIKRYVELGDIPYEIKPTENKKESAEAISNDNSPEFIF